MKPCSSFLLVALLAGASIAQAAPVLYVIDPSHSSVTAEAVHFDTATIRVRFPVKLGTINVDPAAGTGKVTVTIDTAGLSSGVPALDTQLKGIKFFNTRTYPEATFVGTSFAFEGAKPARIDGDLTMSGIGNPVTLTATRFNCYENPMSRKQICGGDFEATVTRSLWNINMAIPFVPDAVHLLIQVEGERQ